MMGGGRVNVPTGRGDGHCPLSRLHPWAVFRTVTGLLTRAGPPDELFQSSFLCLNPQPHATRGPLLSVIASSGPDRVRGSSSRQGAIGVLESDQHPHVAWWMVRAVEEGWSPHVGHQAKGNPQASSPAWPCTSRPDRIWLLFTELMMSL